MGTGYGITNREVATAAWVIIFIAWALSREDIRRAILKLARVLLGRMIVLSLALIAVYVYAETRILSLIGLWDNSHVKDTIIWALTVALIMFVNLSKIRDDDEFFRKSALSNFNASVIVSFFVNLYSFPLVVELLLVPLLALLVALQTFAQLKEEYKILRAPLDSVLATIGLAILVYVAYAIYSDFYSFVSFQIAKDFAVPPALSLLFLPITYGFVLLLRYESLFGRLRYYVPDDNLRRYIKYRLVWVYGVNIWRLNRWAAALPSFELRSKSDLLESLREREYPPGEPPRGFRSLTWGATPPDSMKRIHGPNSEGLSIYRPVADSIPPLFDMPVSEEWYEFLQDKFCSASSCLEGMDKFETMRVALSRSYGPPSFFNDRSHLLKWKWPSRQVEIQLYFAKQHSQTTVTFLNNAI